MWLDSLRLRTIIPHKVDEAAHPTGDLGSPSKLPFYRRRVEGLLSPTTEASLEGNSDFALYGKLVSDMSSVRSQTW